MKKLLGSRGLFCVGAALAMVGLRVALFDYHYLCLDAVPNHDMSQGLAYFSTSMHSVRLDGDIAWWSPADLTGHAQYYQAFLSPLAPTPHHVSFILWAQLVRALAWCGVALPEYLQYLVVNFLVLPFLASLAFAAFVGQFFRRRAAVVVACLAYTLSGIGLWHGAWFYFQEPFSLYLLLAACFAALRRPTGRRLVLLVAAGLLQATSANYWTLYNAFFVAIVLGGYGLTHPVQVRRLGRRALRLGRRHKAAAAVVVVGAVAVLAVWGALLASVVREQGGQYARFGNKPFTAADAAARVQEMRRYTLELFNPNVERPLQSYPVLNPVHNARYVGCALLPPLLLLAVRRWGRRERWLVVAAVGVLLVCLAHPLLPWAWERVPMMSMIRHLFYFYSHHWQVLVVLLAASGVDAVLCDRFGPATRRRMAWAAGGLGVLLALLLVGFGVATQLFPDRDPHLEGNLHFALVTLIATATLLQCLCWPGPRGRNLFAAVVVLLMAGDLGGYFANVSERDREFTAGNVARAEMTDEVRAKLLSPWAAPDTEKGFAAGLVDNMPVTNDLWPRNRFLVPLSELTLDRAAEYRRRALAGPPLGLCRAARVVSPTVEALERLAADEPALPEDRDVVLLHAPPKDAPPEADGPAFLRYSWQRWGYNGFSVRVRAPRPGWVYLRQLHDSYWRVTVDGRRVEVLPANVACMAVAVPAGSHLLNLDYRPPSRRLYWPACWLLEGVLAVLGLVALAARGARVAAVRSGEAAPPVVLSIRASSLRGAVALDSTSPEPV